MSPGILFAVLMLASAPLQAQSFPTRLVRIVTGGLGTGSDVVARLLSPLVSSSLGQQVVVENRASGVVLIETLAKSAPDGHTVAMAGSTFWLTTFLQPGIPWDPLRDFTPIALLSTSPNLVVVHPSVPVKSVKELIALARARPGQLNYGSGAPGSTPHLAAELFNIMANITIVRINYRGVGAAVNDLVGGHVHVMFPNGSAVAGQVAAGRVRALAVAARKPSPLFPNLPTVENTGLAGYEAEVLGGYFAPAKTPAAFVSRIAEETLRAMTRPDVREKLFNAGIEVLAESSEQLVTAMKREMAVYGKLIRDRDIRVE